MSIDQQQLYPLLSVIVLVWGLLDCFFGYRIFKITILFWGAIAGGILGAAAATQLSPEISVMLIGLVIGALIGAGLAFALYLVMVFLMGLCCGFALAALLLPQQQSWIILVCGLVFGVLGGWLALKVQRGVLIVATAMLGSLRAVLAAMYFTHHLDWSYYFSGHPEQLSALLEVHTWLLPVVLGLAIIGILAQSGQGEKSEARERSSDGKKRK